MLYHLFATRGMNILFRRGTAGTVMVSAVLYLTSELPSVIIEKLVILPPFPSLSERLYFSIVSLFMATKKAPAGDPEPYSVLQWHSVR